VAGFLLAVVLVTTYSAQAAAATARRVTRTPLVRVVDLQVGESQTIELCDETTAQVKLVDIEELRDAVRSAVREAKVKVEVNGQQVTVISARYHLPITVSGVQVDCPATEGYLASSNADAWGLVKDARLRLWPAGSALIAPRTFVYPVKQRWFASDTQQKIGVLGKEGGSGGWSHLHFDIQSRQPSGKWGTQEAYAFAWEAYRQE